MELLSPVLLMMLQNPLVLHVAPTAPRVDGSAMLGLPTHLWFACAQAPTSCCSEGGRQWLARAGCPAVCR
jgi:hypothetical protein